MENEKSYDSKILNEIKNIEGVTDVSATRDKRFSINVDEHSINKSSTYWNQNRANLEQRSTQKNGVKVYPNDTEFLGIEDKEILIDVLIDGKENLNKLNDEPYIFIDEECSKSLNLEKGNKVNVDFNTIDTKTNTFKDTISKEFTVGGVIKHLPLTSQGGGTSFGAVMSTNQMNKFTGVASYERIDIWTSKLANQEKVEGELNQIVQQLGKGILIPYKSESAGLEKSDNQKTMIMVLVIGVIVILSLFNCCNTMIKYKNNIKIYWR